MARSRRRLPEGQVVLAAMHEQMHDTRTSPLRDALAAYASWKQQQQDAAAFNPRADPRPKQVFAKVDVRTSSATSLACASWCAGSVQTSYYCAYDQCHGCSGCTSSPSSPPGHALSALLNRVTPRQLPPPSSPLSPPPLLRVPLYITNHLGFIAALALVLLLPLTIFLSCCVVRRCRRMAAQREAVRKNQEAIGAHRKKKEEEASGGVPEAVLVEETVPEMLTPAAAAYGVVVDMKRDAYGTEPVSYPLGDPRGRPPLPPVVINPAFLPVDAYFGVPPKRFDL